MRNKHFIFMWFIICVVGLASAERCFATPIEADVPAGGEVTVYWTGTPGDETGARVENLLLSPITMGIEQLPQPPEAEVTSGFRLIDTTMLNLTTVPSADGRMRARVRIAYREDRLRGGEREDALTLMRLVDRPMRRKLWRPCERVMTRRMLDATRKKGPALFQLGYYGMDTTDDYVWAVLDIGGSYAIGVPEPISLVMFAAGAALLLHKRNRRATH